MSFPSRAAAAALLVAAASACVQTRAITLAPLNVFEERYQQPTQVEGLVRELRMIDVTLDGAKVSLEALMTRPRVGGPWPLVLLSHGSPRAQNLRDSSPATYSAQAIWFASRGYAVAAVMRPGYGKSEGNNQSTTGPCTNRDYLKFSLSSAAVIAASRDALVKEPWVDPSRVVLMGVSTGGLSSVAAATLVPVTAVVSFAGGSGSSSPDSVCQPERLVDAMRTLGETSRVPNFWIYAENDHFFGPQLARDMRDAYSANGAPVRFEMMPPFEDDGHTLVADVTLWASKLESFLRELGLPTAEGVVVPRPVLPPGSFPGVGTRKALVKYFERDGFEKAFATNGRAWGSGRGRRTARDAIELAMVNCGKHATNCVVYAIGDALAPDAEARLAIAMQQKDTKPPPPPPAAGVLGGVVGGFALPRE